MTGAEPHQSRALIPVLEKIPERSDIEKINMRTSPKKIAKVVPAPEIRVKTLLELN